MSSPKPDTTESNRPPTRTLLAALAVTFALIALATFLPGARQWRLWGLNHLAFYEAPVRIAAVIFMVLTFVPAVARPLYDGLLRIPEALAGIRHSTLVIVLIAVGSVFLFHELRAATTLLGDGQLLLKSFEVGHAGRSDTVVMRSVHAILTTEFIAPGMTLLYYGLMKLLAGPFGRTVAESLVWLPCILGGVYVYFLLRFVRDLPSSATIKAWLLVLGIFTASLQLFFGYIENYSAILLFLMLYSAAGFMTLHGRTGVWLPIVLLVVSFYTHIQSLVFAPSLIYLIAWRVSGRDDRRGGRIILPVLAILTVAGALVGRTLGIPGDFYLPLTENEDSYGIISPGHLLDMLNEVFMLLPIVLFVIAAWAAGRRAAAGKKGGGQAWFNTPREWHFVALMLVACTVYMTLFEPEIGMARDWDLFTMTIVALVPLVLLVINRFLRHADADTASMARVSIPAMAMAAVLTVSWIGINASADRTTDRFESILAYDTTHVGYAYENLATFYYNRDQLPRAIAAMEKGAIISGNPRIYARLAKFYEENGDLNSGITILSGAVERYPDHQKARQKLVDLLEKGQRWEDLVRVAREGTEYHPDTPIYCFALGIGLIRTGATDEGVRVFRECLNLDMPDAMRRHMEGFINHYSGEKREGQ